MSLYTVWWHVMLSGVFILMPIVVLLIIFCAVATKILDWVPTPVRWIGFWLSFIGLLLVLTSAMSVAWVTVMVEDCGFLERHLPIEEELYDKCT